MSVIRASAATRVDLMGGTLDIEPLTYLLDHKATVNCAVDLRSQAKLTLTPSRRAIAVSSQDRGEQFEVFDFSELNRVTQLPLAVALIAEFWSSELPGFTLELDAKSPAGAGLGGSSSLAVSIAACLQKARMLLLDEAWPEKRDFVHKIRDCETKVIHCPAGTQDYWGALNGGVNLLQFPAGGEQVTRLSLDAVGPLADSMLLCYSGQSRQSGLNNWAIFKAAFDGDQTVLAQLNEIGQLAEQGLQAILRSDWFEAIEVAKQEWLLRLAIWPAIATTKTRHLADIGKANGARLARVCGAGGGGVMLFLVEPDQKESLAAALHTGGGTLLTGGLSNDGLLVQVEGVSDD